MALRRSIQLLLVLKLLSEVAGGCPIGAEHELEDGDVFVKYDTIWREATSLDLPHGATRQQLVDAMCAATRGTLGSEKPDSLEVLQVGELELEVSWKAVFKKSLHSGSRNMIVATAFSSELVSSMQSGAIQRATLEADPQLGLLVNNSLLDLAFISGVTMFNQLTVSTPITSPGGGGSSDGADGSGSGSGSGGGSDSVSGTVIGLVVGVVVVGLLIIVMGVLLVCYYGPDCSLRRRLRRGGRDSRLQLVDERHGGDVALEAPASRLPAGNEHVVIGMGLQEASVRGEDGPVPGKDPQDSVKDLQRKAAGAGRRSAATGGRVGDAGASSSSGSSSSSGAEGEGGVLKAKLEVAFHRLTFIKQIGRGEFKKVYLGRWDSTQVAIVRMSRGGQLREALVLQRLSLHPNLVHFYRWAKDEDGNEYMVMELVSKGSLDSLLRKNGKSMRTHAKITICQQVCAAMMALASEGITHGDLAARNVLVAAVHPCIHVKVTDFGLAKVHEHWHDKVGVTSSNYIPVRWASPELLRRAEWSEKSDVWSFGVTMWEIFSNGALPHDDLEDEKKIAPAVSEGRLLQQPNKCPDEVYAIMRSCWEHNPKKRPGFKALAKQLEQAQERVRRARNGAGPLSGPQAPPSVAVMPPARQLHSGPQLPVVDAALAQPEVVIEEPSLPAPQESTDFYHPKLPTRDAAAAAGAAEPQQEALAEPQAAGAQAEEEQQEPNGGPVTYVGKLEAGRQVQSGSAPPASPWTGRAAGPAAEVEAAAAGSTTPTAAAALRTEADAGREGSGPQGRMLSMRAGSVPPGSQLFHDWLGGDSPNSGSLQSSAGLARVARCFSAPQLWPLPFADAMAGAGVGAGGDPERPGTSPSSTPGSCAVGPGMPVESGTASGAGPSTGVGMLTRRQRSMSVDLISVGDALDAPASASGSPGSSAAQAEPSAGASESEPAEGPRPVEASEGAGDDARPAAAAAGSEHGEVAAEPLSTQPSSAGSDNASAEASEGPERQREGDHAHTPAEAAALGPSAVFGGRCGGGARTRAESGRAARPRKQGYIPVTTIVQLRHARAHMARAAYEAQGNGAAPYDPAPYSRGPPPTDVWEAADAYGCNPLFQQSGWWWQPPPLAPHPPHPQGAPPPWPRPVAMPPARSPWPSGQAPWPQDGGMEACYGPQQLWGLPPPPLSPPQVWVNAHGQPVHRGPLLPQGVYPQQPMPPLQPVAMDPRYAGRLRRPPPPHQQQQQQPAVAVPDMVQLKEEQEEDWHNALDDEEDGAAAGNLPKRQGSNYISIQQASNDEELEFARPVQPAGIRTAVGGRQPASPVFGQEPVAASAFSQRAPGQLQAEEAGGRNGGVLEGWMGARPPAVADASCPPPQPAAATPFATQGQQVGWRDPAAAETQLPPPLQAAPQSAPQVPRRIVHPPAINGQGEPLPLEYLTLQGGPQTVLRIRPPPPPDNMLGTATTPARLPMVGGARMRHGGVDRPDLLHGTLLPQHQLQGRPAAAAPDAAGDSSMQSMPMSSSTWNSSAGSSLPDPHMVSDGDVRETLYQRVRSLGLPSSLLAPGQSSSSWDAPPGAGSSSACQWMVNSNQSVGSSLPSATGSPRGGAAGSSLLPPHKEEEEHA